MSERSGLGWRAIQLFTCLVYFFMFGPVVVIVLLAFNPVEFGSFPMQGVTLHWFIELAHNEAIVSALGTSLLLGALTTIFATLLGVPAAIAMVRYEFPGKSWVNALLTMPILVPHVVLAVGILLFLRWLGMPKNFALLVLGHVVIALPFVVLVTQSRLYAIPRVYEDAAMSLGANRFQTFCVVTLPLLMPAILAGMLFAFTVSFDEITATLFWKPPGIETVPTQVLAMLRLSISQEINALATVMIALTVGLPLLALLSVRMVARRKEAAPQSQSVRA